MERPANQTVWLGTKEIALRMGQDAETIRLWITRGARTPFGGVVKLRALQVGKRWIVRRKWLRVFLQALEAGNQMPPEPMPVEPTDRQQERASEAKRRLQERLGRRKRT